MKKITFLLLFFSHSCFSQLEASKWHFGLYGALDFQAGSPVFVNNSAMNNSWPAGSIADSVGNLLFYSDAHYIWNKNNVVMANGTDVGGVQNVLIIRKTGTQYYVFLTNWTLYNNSMINYATVDMSLAGGLGSVTATYQPISPKYQKMTSKLAGTRHCNQKDYWVLTHATENNSVGSQDFYAYHVTKDSVNRNPVISSIGYAQTWTTNVGGGGSGFSRLKFSPNGKKVCAAYNPGCVVEVYDFDNASGTLSNMIQLESITSSTGTNIYTDPISHGVEFSPDGSKLYVSYVNKRPAICQYNLCAGSSSAIIASKTIICADTFPSPTSSPANEMREFQLAIDGKIYVTDNGLNSVGVISNPNALGALCNYSAQAISLGTNTLFNSPAYCNRGLPNFVSNYFEQKPILSSPATASCGMASFSSPTLCAYAGYSVTAYNWNFGDPVSGSSNTSNALSPNHVFTANGTYTVALVLQYPCGADTLKKTLSITNLPNLNLSGKTKICKGESLQVNFSGASSYSLNGTALSQSSVTLNPSVTTSYTISGSDNSSGCISTKAYKITVDPCTGLLGSDSEITGISVYPNPNHGIFSVDLKENTMVEIVDLTGRSVYKESLQTGKHEIDLSNSANGFYLLHAKNGRHDQTIKLLKE